MTTLTALLAASAAFTAPVAGTSDPLAVPPPAAKPGTVKVTVNVKAVPLITDGTPVKRAGRQVKAAPSSGVVTDKVEAAPRAPVDGENSGTLPVTLIPGTYNAVRFMEAWRHAKTRSEQVTALSGYKGYDFKRDFSSQEIEARFYVKRETTGIAPGTDRTTLRNAQRTAAGFVAGMPHENEKIVMNLLAQERNVVETMISHQHIAQDEKASAQDRAIARNAIKQGEALLAAIRQEKANLGVADVEDMLSR